MAAYPIATMADGGIKYSDGSVKYASYKNAIGTGTGGYPVYPNAGLGQQTSNPNPQPTNTGGGGGGGGGSSNDPFQEVWDPNLKMMRKQGDIWAEQDRLRAEQAERENRVRGNIESAYGNIKSQLDQMLGELPGQQSQDEARLKTNLDMGLEGLGTAKTGSLANLGVARTGVEQGVRQANTDIQSQLRNLLQASQQKIGLMGAGSSSASQVMLPYAMGKQAAQAGAKVAGQGLTQMNEIAMKENDVNTTYDMASNQLKQDYNTQLQSMVDKFRDWKSQIDQAKMNADERRLQALNQLEVGIMNNLQNEAQALKQTYMNYSMQVEDWARNRIAQLQDYKIQMQNSGNFNPQQLTWDAMQGVGDLRGYSGQASSDPYGYNVMAMKKRNELMGMA